MSFAQIASKLPVDFRIRPARPDDLEALDRIESRSFTHDRFPRRNLRRLLASSAARFLVAESDARVAGYAMVLLRRGSAVARLYSIAVDPDFRGRRLAESLLDAAADESLRSGATRLRLELRPSNAGAMRLYQRAGFTIFERRPGYYGDGEDAIRMERRLAPKIEGDRSAHS